MLEGQLITYQGVLYKKLNLPVLAIWSLNGLEIGQPMADLGAWSKLPLGLNNPVYNDKRRAQVGTPVSRYLRG